MPTKIRPLTLQDRTLCEAFHCGNIILDEFIRSDRAMEKWYGKTYVLLNDNHSRMIGFYNITTADMEYLDNQKRYKAAGAMHINMLGVDMSYQGIVGYDVAHHPLVFADYLLNDCIQRAENLRSKHLGFSFITLSSTQQGYDLYTRNGFINANEDLSFSVMQGNELCTPMYYCFDAQE